MKKILQIILLASFSLFANSVKASGGPDAYGYTWITSLDAGGPAFNWIDITSRAGVQTVSGLADDNSAVSMINLGINFHYYWNDYTQLKVGSNGWVSFSNVSNIASCFPTIPTSGGPDDYLAPFLSDLNFTGAGNVGQVKYWSNNVDTFIISYINVPFWSVSAPGWSGSNSFQVILCNSDSSITYQYGSLGSGFLNNAGCNDMTVGIENSTGAVGLQVHSDVMPPSNYAIRFDYPATVLLSIRDVLPKWNLHSDNGADFIFQNIPITLSSDIHNSGNSNITTTINLQSTILNSALTTILTNTGSLPTFAAGDDTVYTYSNPWTPNATGQYTNRTTTSCSQDINSANDVLNTELDVVNPCSPNMLLSYVTGNTPSNTINWNGGANDDGTAVYFVPPVYPYTVSTLQYYISSNVSDGYIAQIYDDNGPNGSQGTLLFSTTVPSSSVVTGAWNTVNVSSAVTLNSGGFYVAWLQGGTSIFLGSETAGPRCHRNYEILDGSWATLRYDDAQDLCIRAGITGYVSTPTAAFTSSSNILTTNFTDNTTGLVTSWSWDFGDGSPVSTLQNPVHTYAAAGTYTVCLTSTSPCGTNQFCQTITVCNPPTASYAASVNALDVNFTDASTGTVTSWSWDFGDGSPVVNSQNAAHTYAASGTYTVCLTISNACGGNDVTCQTITVCALPVAAFTTSNNILDVTFADQTTNSPVSWSWDFGDAQTSTQQNPVHTYASAGTYTVCLIATNSCGGADTICSTINVCNQLNTSFTSTQNEDTLFASDQTANAVTWLWDFGNGDNSTVQNPVYEYLSAGVYTVCLTTTDMCGDADSVCHSVFIIVTSADQNNGELISGSYPNPVENELNISFSKELNKAQLEIFDQTGRVVEHYENVSGNKLSLNVGEFPAGIYMIRVVNEDNNSTLRFIKE